MNKDDLFLCRSLLFIPSQERFLKKIENNIADAIIVDLEDAIPDNQKAEALQRLYEYLNYNVNCDIFVRVNRKTAIEEISLLNKKDIKGYVIPKVEFLSDITDLMPVVQGKMIIALIESPMGIVNLKETVSCSYVHAVAFGAEDFRSYYTEDIGEHGIIYAKSKMATIARAYNKPAFDSISLEYKHIESFKAEAFMSKSYGFSGKLAIHPSQIPAIHEVFRNFDYEYYEYVVEKYDESSEGIIKLDGCVYERPHIEMIRRRLQQRPLCRNNKASNNVTSS